MTEKLKTLMDEVTGMVDHDFALPDLDAITAAGDRTVRRRRVTAGASALLLGAVVATGAVLLGGRGDDRAQFTDDLLDPDVPMWTIGSTLHTPDGSFDLGIDVVSVSRTAEGIAFVGADGGVRSFDGVHTELLGSAADTDLSQVVSDAQGTWIAWVDQDGDRRTFAAHDLATGTTLFEPFRLDPDGEEPLDTGLVLAVDGSTAYWLDARGTTAIDLVSSEKRRVGEPGEMVLVIGAENGTLVRWRESATGGDLGTDVVGADGSVLLGYRQVGTVGALSPDGRWVASLDSALVWDVRSGARVDLATGAPLDAIGYEWLDEDSLMVLAEIQDDDTALRLMRCEVPTGDCTDVTTVDFSGDRLALPTFGLMPAFSFGGAEADSAEGSDSSAPQTSSTERPE